MDKKNYKIAGRAKRQIEKSLMVIHVKREIIGILQIMNRRFMYSPQTEILILGDEMYGKSICSSHAQEFHASKAEGRFDDYLRGWIGASKTIPAELSILPPLLAWSSSIGDLTRCKCLLNLKVPIGILWSGDFAIPRK